GEVVVVVVVGGAIFLAGHRDETGSGLLYRLVLGIALLGVVLVLVFFPGRRCRRAFALGGRLRRGRAVGGRLRRRLVALGGLLRRGASRWHRRCRGVVALARRHRIGILGGVTRVRGRILRRLLGLRIRNVGRLAGLGARRRGGALRLGRLGLRRLVLGRLGIGRLGLLGAGLGIRGRFRDGGGGVGGGCIGDLGEGRRRSDGDRHGEGGGTCAEACAQAHGRGPLSLSRAQQLWSASSPWVRRSTIPYRPFTIDPIVPAAAGTNKGTVHDHTPSEIPHS